MPVQTVESQLADLIDRSGDFDEAERILAKRPELARHVLRLGWSAAVERAKHQERVRVKSIRLVPQRGVSDIGRRVAASAREKLLSAYGVQPTTTREELLARASAQREQGDGHHRTAAFLERLAVGLQKGGTVAKLTDAQVDGARALLENGKAERDAA